MSLYTDPMMVESEADLFCHEYLLVQGWRQEQFELLGFDPVDAAMLAATDTHHSYVRRLLSSGATQAQALQVIL